jgi:hypothetical protein
VVRGPQFERRCRTGSRAVHRVIHMSKFKWDVKEALKSVKVVPAGRCLRCEVYTVESGRSKEYE